MIKFILVCLFLFNYNSILAFAKISNNIDQKTKVFLKHLSEHKGKQLYELTPKELRFAFDLMQKNPINMPQVDVVKKNIIIDGVEMHLTIVKPAFNKDKILPVVVFFHGGGWVMGNYKNHELLIAKIASGSNVAVVAFDYPLAPENKYPIAINQSYSVTKWISENGSEIGVDGTRLAVAGNSAGGNIAAVVSQMAKDKNTPFIKYQILLSPVVDLVSITDSFKKFGNGDYLLSKKLIEYFRNNYVDKSKRKNIYVSPAMADIKRLKGLPKTLIITAEYDMHRDEGENYAYKLMQAGVDVTSVRYLGTIHSPESLNAISDTPAAKSVIDQINEELKRNICS